MTAASRAIEATAIEAHLLVSFDIGKGSWKFAFTTGLAQRAGLRTIFARDTAAVQGEVAHAKEKFSLSASCEVKTCYEAGRDGFWLHRWYERAGIDNRVIDASSIEGNRRLRRAKARTAWTPDGS